MYACLHLLAACLLGTSLSMISVTTYVSSLSNFVSRLAVTCIQAEKLGLSTPRIHASTYFRNYLFTTDWSGSNGIRSAYSASHPIRVSVLVRREAKNHLGLADKVTVVRPPLPNRRRIFLKEQAFVH
ncbi:hypothetical protein V8C40DRAFT_256445 [Trichoderma camerunense]